MKKKVAIVGGGIAGLTAAYLLHKKYEVVLYEKTNRLGGWIQSIEKNGFLFELGPRGFRPHGKGQFTLQLCRELGLEPIAANANAKKRFLLRDGKLKEVTLFSFAKYLPQILREMNMKPVAHDETIFDFFARRFGKNFTEHFVEPMVGGIFGGNAKDLSMQLCLPAICAWEKNYGGVVRGFFSTRKKSELPPLYSFKDGMETLPRTLVERISGKVQIVLNKEVEEVDCDHVIWLHPQKVPHLTLTTVNLGWNRDVLPFPGFGYLVPSSENEEILGVTFDSSIFPEQKGETRLTVMMRGEKTLECALHAVRRHLGMGNPDVVHVQIARNAIPQYLLGQPPIKSRVGINETLDAMLSEIKHLL